MTLYFSDPAVENCHFLNNGSTNRDAFAMAIRADSLPRLKNNSAQGNGNDAIGVFGFNFNRTGTWVKDNLPYMIVEDLFVNTGKTMTIEPGVVVQFQGPEDALVVDGTLLARGTEVTPIRFTSDDAEKKPGQWEAIYFRDASVDADTILENCLVESGGANAEGSIAIYTASPRITGCTVVNSSSDGIHVNRSSPAITRCRVLRNGRDGIRAVSGSNPVISGSVIAGNTGFGMQNFDTTLIVNARGNYWGDPSGPLDTLNTDGRGQTNPNGRGDKVSEYVDWGTFLQDVTLAGNGVSPGPGPTITPEDGNWSATNATLQNTGEAELVVRVGDIDNLNFGWPSGFNPFSGNSTPVHSFPWTVNTNDPPGTDRIMVVTSYNRNPPAGQDGYTGSTTRPGNSVQPIVLTYNLGAINVTAAMLQIFVDDFQAPVWKASYQVTLNGLRAPFLESIINSPAQTGPVGKLITVPIPPDFLFLVRSGRLSIEFDDRATGAGDGYAIDFARLLINPRTLAQTGSIRGKVIDGQTQTPLTGATISINTVAIAQTDAIGNYALTNVAAGLVSVSAAGPGYQNQVKLSI